MKTSFYIGVGVAAVLSVAAANAQVLGGSATGALGGTLSGGMRDMGLSTQGSGNGSFDSDFGTGALGRAGDIGGRATSRVRNSTEAVGGRTRSTLRDARSRGNSAVTTAAGTARDTANAARQVEATASAAGSIASDASVAGNQAAGAVDGAHQQQLLAAPVSGQQAETGGIAQTVTGSTANPVLPPSTDSNAAPDSTATPVSQSLLSNGSLGATQEHGAAQESATQESAEGSGAPVASVIEGSGTGSASGDASASRRGVSANASAEADGSANASLKR